jgi:hypothetical protein
MDPKVNVPCTGHRAYMKRNGLLQGAHTLVGRGRSSHTGGKRKTVMRPPEWNPVCFRGYRRIGGNLQTWYLGHLYLTLGESEARKGKGTQTQTVVALGRVPIRLGPQGRLP